MNLISKINEMKNTEQMNCPHCAVMDLFNFSSPKETQRILKKYLKLKGRDLDALITASEELLHPRIFGILDAVRKTGNFGAHLKEDADTEELFFVENDEARLAVRAVVDVALDWFVENVKAQEFLQQITKKFDILDPIRSLLKLIL